MVILLKEERLSFNETEFLFWCHALWKLRSSNCCFFEMKRATEMETCAKIFFFVYLQPSVNKNSWNFAQFWLYNLMTSLWRHIIFATRKKPLAPSIWPYFYSIYRPYPIYENSYLAPRHGAIKQKKCIIHFWACILIYRSWFIEHHQLSFNRYCKSLINCVVKNQRT